MKNRYNRRDFIKRMGLLYGSLLVVPGCVSAASTYRIFSLKEASCLVALCEQIIPADEYPGATDAGVIHYIDKQTYLRFPDDKNIYQKGIEALQSTCLDKSGRLFEELESAVQIDIMKDMEQNKLPDTYWEEVQQSAFFNLVLSRTMQGFYGSPRHGGNKDYVSYRMMKLDYPLLIGQNRYKNGE